MKTRKRTLLLSAVALCWGIFAAAQTQAVPQCLSPNDWSNEGPANYFWAYYLQPECGSNPAAGAYGVYSLSNILGSNMPLYPTGGTGGSGSYYPSGGYPTGPNPESGTFPGDQNPPGSGEEFNPEIIFGDGGEITPTDPIVNPEPASIFLIGTGMMGLGYLGRRMRKVQN